MSNMQFFFLELIGRLKNTLRRGWELRKMLNPESVSDYMYHMAIMCLMVPRIDNGTRIKAIKMALTHDMGEAIIGDITPSNGISLKQKFEWEEMTLTFLTYTLRPSNPDFTDSLLDLWHEYEEGRTKTAILVKELEKLECIHQAIVYEERSGIDHSKFMTLKEKVTLLVWHEDIKQRKEIVPIIIFVSRGPSIGKGTQSARLAQEFGFHHISIGDLLRNKAESPSSPYREFILESIQRSILIPAQLTTQLLRQAIGGIIQGQKRQMVLLNGFPRNVAQVTNFESKIYKDYATISLDCSKTELLSRLQSRSTRSARIDDNPESITKRLKTFNMNNTKVLEYLQKHGPLFHIQCRGSINDVYVPIRAAVQEILDMHQTM